MLTNTALSTTSDSKFLCLYSCLPLICYGNSCLLIGKMVDEMMTQLPIVGVAVNAGMISLKGYAAKIYSFSSYYMEKVIKCTYTNSQSLTQSESTNNPAGLSAISEELVTFSLHMCGFKIIRMQVLATDS